MTLTKSCLLTLLLVSTLGRAEPPGTDPVGQAPVWIGRFDTGQSDIPAPWEVRSVTRRVPPTQYQLRLWDGVAAVEALADHSMAMLARPVAVDLARTPVLCWRWRVDATIATADMRSKGGDDYAARVYVAFRLPASAMGAATRFKLGLARRLFDSAVPDAALNYVWDNRQPVGTEMASAYTDRVQMLVLQSGDHDSGQWRSERRNVLGDFTRRFGAVQPTVDFIAFGADADNTGSRAHAGFADLHFVGPDAPCMLSGPAVDVRP
jgi:hypothetical protein